MRRTGMVLLVSLMVSIYGLASAASFPIPLAPNPVTTIAADGPMEIRGDPDTIELMLTLHLQDEPSDGGFEIGLVREFLSRFGSHAGFTVEPFTFHDAQVAGNPVKVANVRLTKDTQSLTALGYIDLTQPSLVFITIRPHEAAQAERDNIETSFAALQIR